MSNRVAIFIDGDNLYYAQRDYLGWRIDMERLLKYLSQYGDNITEANYYMSIIEDNVDDRKKSFMDALNHIGWRVITDTPKPIYGADGVTTYKTCTDMMLAVDAMNRIDHYDMAILLTGDNDFAYLLKMLGWRGKDYLLLSTDGLVSHCLKSEAGVRYLDLASLKNDVVLQFSQT